jgi:hypothetical protein
MMINLILLSYLASVAAWFVYIKKNIWSHKLKEIDELEWIVIISFSVLWPVLLPLSMIYTKRQKAIVQKKKELEELVK